MIKDRQKLPIHDRLGDGRPDFHDVPQMLPEGPRGIPRGFPPGGGPIGPGMHPRPHDGPPFMHGPGSMGMGEFVCVRVGGVQYVCARVSDLCCIQRTHNIIMSIVPYTYTCTKSIYTPPKKMRTCISQ